MRVAIGILAALLIATPASSVEDQDLAKCAVMAGDLDRLSCFDDLVRNAGLDAPQPQAVPETASNAGKWSVRRDKNPLDDSERVVLILRADSGESRFNGPIGFVARCQSNSTEAFINWGDYLGNDGTFRNEYKNVTVRIGDGQASTQRWDLSTDSKATFAPNWAGDLLKKMAGANKLVVQTTPYNENPVTAIFDTTGMADALAPLMEVCGWSL
jgi:type VI secretion system protein VasI